MIRRVMEYILGFMIVAYVLCSGWMSPEEGKEEER